MMTSDQIRTQMGLGHAIKAIKREIKKGDLEYGKMMLDGLRSAANQIEAMLKNGK